MATTQTGFRLKYIQEDLFFPVEVMVFNAQCEGAGLILCFIDLKNAFDTVPIAHLMYSLLNYSSIDPTFIEQVCQLIMLHFQ